MTIAEKLTAIAENQQRVYDAGVAVGKHMSKYAEGYAAGQQDEHDRFWDAYQDNNGNYQNAFANPGWTDETFNPKQPIICTTGNAQQIFQKAEITDTKVPIEIRVAAADMMFYQCKKLKTIRSLGFFGVTAVSSMFSQNTALENLIIDGEINVSISLSASSKLTNVSVQSIIDHLADLTGQTAKKLTLHADVGAAMTEWQKAEITAKNWTLVY